MPGKVLGIVGGQDPSDSKSNRLHVDGFYINSPDNSIYSSTTNTHMNLNSDHYPITLHLPHNTLLARPIPPNNNTQTRIINPIPPENLEKFSIKFFEENSIQINALNIFLENHDHLANTNGNMHATNSII